MASAPSGSRRRVVLRLRAAVTRSRVVVERLSGAGARKRSHGARCGQELGGGRNAGAAPLLLGRRVQLRRVGRIRRRGRALVVRDALDAGQHTSRTAARGEGASRPAYRCFASWGCGARERIHPVISRGARALSRDHHRGRRIRGAHGPDHAASHRRGDLQVGGRRSRDPPVRARRLAAAAGLLLAAADPVRAQAVPAGPPTGEGMTATLVTVGLGREVFERFVHNALWVHDARTGQDVVYHWGLFSFNEPHFIARFLTGDTHYWMGGEDARALLASGRSSGRPITLQHLALRPGRVAHLRQFWTWTPRAENKFYRYDYFRDNCSTRLRDALDLALDGP